MKVIIIGAGPAGLTAAWEFSKHKIQTIILEGDSETGGISRTVDRNGWKFDIGGHRFTKSKRFMKFGMKCSTKMIS